ncbi:MAG: hypothetical protein V1827_00875 [Candidatus Micrarchaeota archaeon]
MDLKDVASLALPLLLIPLTLYSVSSFGHDAGNAIIGLAFLICFARFADAKERWMMITLAILATLFETANVATGSYRYAGTNSTPIWVCLGWGILGIYLLKNQRVFAMAGANAAYAIAALAYLGAWLYTGALASMLLYSLFAVLTVYALGLVSERPPSFFLSAGLLGVIIELCGTSFKVWSYFGPGGGIIPVNTGSIGLAYATVVAFGMFLCGLDKKKG